MVDQRARHQQEIGQGAQHMSGMNGEEIEPECRRGEREGLTQSDSYEGCAQASVRRLNFRGVAMSPPPTSVYAFSLYLFLRAALIQRK